MDRHLWTMAMCRVLLIVVPLGFLQVPLWGSAVLPGTVVIHVSLKDPTGHVGTLADAVVWLPKVGGEKSEGASAPQQIAQREKQFQPHVEVVRVGARIDFPNQDRIYHNVFSLSEIARFDLGLYRGGASRSVTFDKPGVVRVYCNIHPQMAAYVVVVDSEYFVKTGADGAAELKGVPAGGWPVRIWHERAKEWQGHVEVSPEHAGRLQVVLDGANWRSQPHSNKYGKDYPLAEDDEIRY